MQTRRPTLYLAGLAFVVAAGHACSKSKSDSSDTPPGDEGQPGTLNLTGDLATSYPEGLALSVLPSTIPDALPESLAASGTLAVGGAALTESPAQDEYDPNAASVSDKVQEAAAKLAGEGECFSPELLSPKTFDLNSVECYHPDRDLNFVDGTPDTSDPKPLFDDTAEACMVGYTRQAMSATVALVDQATGLALAMLCQAKKDEVATGLPAVDETLDLQTSLAAATANAGITIDAASIKRLADDADGRPVYKTEIVISATQPNVSKKEIHLLHSPSKDHGNETFNGRLWVRSGQANAQTVDHLSITYARSGTTTEPNIKYQLLQGEFVKEAGSSDPFATVVEGDPFASDGALDLNLSATFTGNTTDQAYGKFPADTTGGNALNNTLAGQLYIAFDMNPLTNEGQLTFWKNFGGNYGESARGMVFNLTKQEDNSLAGCSVSGAAGSGPNEAYSIRKAQKDGLENLTPLGYYHPQGDQSRPSADPTCDDGLCQFAPWVYRQCFKQGTDGVYGLDDDKITDAATGYDILAPDAADVTLPDMTSLPVISL